MKIKLEIINEDISDNLRLEGDDLRRLIMRRYPNAVWERHGEGHEIFI